MIRSFVIPAIAALSIAGAAAPAAAETQTRHVSYADLDLSAAPGRAELRERVSSAVEDVCGPIEVRSVRSAMEVQTCRTGAWSMVQPQLNAALGATVEVLADARITIEKPRPPRARG